jgi:RNA polymerase sigma factor (sigma-70 family)
MMASGDAGAVQREVHRIFQVGPVAGLSDAQLLERFVARQGDAKELAFAALVARHGPMVLAACRHLLGDPHEADDAFQATFLVLARRARSLWIKDSLGHWLHGVAYRVATRARAVAARRKTRERSGAEWEAEAPAAEDPHMADLRPALHEEVARLPAKYRAPVVLCYLEGLTHDEAAQQLRCPVGTVRSRLSRARERLRARLTRRGFAPTAGVLGASLAAGEAPAAVPAPLFESTIKAALGVAAGRAAAGLASATAVALTEGVLRTMFLGKLKLLATVVVAVGAVATGAGVLAYQDPAPEARPRAAPRIPPPRPRAAEVASPEAQAPGEAPRARGWGAVGTRGRAEAKPASPRTLEVRLKQAQRLFLTRSRQFRDHLIGQEDLDQAHDEATLIRAEIEAQRDDLRDELELLEAQLATKRAEIEGTVVRADLANQALARLKSLVERGAVSTTELVQAQSEATFQGAQAGVKKAEAAEIQVRIKQVKRRLDQFDGLIAKGTVSQRPDPPAADPPPTPADAAAPKAP